jgi:hypothetical protein
MAKSTTNKKQDDEQQTAIPDIVNEQVNSENKKQDDEQQTAIPDIVVDAPEMNIVKVIGENNENDITRISLSVDNNISRSNQ